MNEQKLSRIEKQLNPQPEIKTWIPVELCNGRYRNHSTRQPMTDEEYQELANRPATGLIIVKRTETPLSED